MPYNIILYCRLQHFHVSNSALFFYIMTAIHKGTVDCIAREYLVCIFQYFIVTQLTRQEINPCKTFRCVGTIIWHLKQKLCYGMSFILIRTKFSEDSSNHEGISDKLTRKHNQ